MSSNDINCPTSLSIGYEFVSDPEIVHSILQRATDDLGAGNSSANDKANVEIVMAEAINNIIEHAYQFERNQPVEVLLTEKDGHLTIAFVDEGRPMPFGQIPAEKPNDINCSPNDLPEGGFGWQIIRSLSDSICYSRKGGRNLLKLKLKLADSH